MLRHVCLLFAVCFACLLTSCGGNTVTPEPQTENTLVANPALEAGLPSLPTGDLERTGSLLDTDQKLGSEFFDELQCATSAPSCTLEPPEDMLAYAMYQFPERPGQPEWFELSGQYIDSTPLEDTHQEGYYLAFADYTANRWRIIGPFTRSYFKTPLPAGPDYISPGGFIYAAVISTDEQFYRVDSIRMGYYTVFDYGEEWLPPVAGSSVGAGCNLALDPSGKPQIAYLSSPIVTFGDTEARPWVARQVGNEWVTEEVPTPYSVDTVQLALGHGDRRALLMKTNESPRRLVLRIDEGAGFGPDIELNGGYSGDYYPDLMWVNAAGDPAGVRNILIVVYQLLLGFPDSEIHYYRWDGIGPGVDSIVSVGTFDSAKRLSLARLSTGSLLLTIPDYVALDRTDFYAHEYDPPVGWLTGTYPDLLDVPAEHSDRYNPAALVCELESGELGGAIIQDEDEWVLLGRTQAGVWESSSYDAFAVRISELLDIDVLGNQIVFPTVNGNMNPVLYMKYPLAAQPPDILPIDLEEVDVGHNSMEIGDDGIIHFCMLTVDGGGLVYYRINPEVEITKQLVDNGGQGTGYYFDALHLVEADGALFTFALDAAHLTIRCSTMYEGVWYREAVPLEIDGNPYIIYDAGYLENTDLLYVCFLDILDFNSKIVTFTPDLDNFATNNINQPIIEGPVTGFFAVADDETDVGVLTFSYFYIFEDVGLDFMVGDPRSFPLPKEAVHLGQEAMEGGHFLLNYNLVNDTWEAVTHGDDHQLVNYFHREMPGMWLGPVPVAMMPEGDPPKHGFAHAVGLDDNVLTGDSYVTVRLYEDNTLTENLSIFVRYWNTGLFSLPVLVRPVDLTTRDIAQVKTVPSADGRPIIGSCYESPPDTWRIWTLAPTTGLTYENLYYWASPVEEPLGLINAFDIAYLAENEVAASLIEGEETTGKAGQPVVYYPW